MNTYTENTMVDTTTIDTSINITNTDTSSIDTITINIDCINGDFKKSFMHGLCMEINHPDSMHLRQYHNDDPDAVKMIFATENSKQFQPAFCHVCGNYMSQLNYSRFENISTPRIWCRDESHFKATNKLAILMRIKNANRSIEHWTKQISEKFKKGESINSEISCINSLSSRIKEMTQELSQLK